MISSAKRGYNKRYAQAHKKQIAAQRKKCHVAHWDEYVARERERSLLRRYGMMPWEYDGRKAAQGFRCAICGRADRKLELDHDHITGRIREFLCHGCNHNLAYVENESVQRPFLEYLKKFNDKGDLP